MATLHQQVFEWIEVQHSKCSMKGALDAQHNTIQVLMFQKNHIRLQRHCWKVAKQEFSTASACKEQKSFEGTRP